MKEQTKLVIKEWTESIIIAVILALFIRTLVIQAFKIPAGSMIPTFQVGDRIFVNKFIYGAKVPFLNMNLPAVRSPKRGDILVFIAPDTPQKDFIKRLIAVGGEKVQIKDGRIFINGKIVDEPSSVRSVYYYNSGDYGREGRVIEVPKDSYFVMGDNSASSRDSRFWGFVPRKNLLGRAIFIYWPLHRMKIIN